MIQIRIKELKNNFSLLTHHLIFSILKITSNKKKSFTLKVKECMPLFFFSFKEKEKTYRVHLFPQKNLEREKNNEI